MSKKTVESMIADIHNGVEHLNELLTTQREQQQRHHQQQQLYRAGVGAATTSYYEIRRTLRQLDQSMVSLEVELNEARLNNEDEYTVATRSLLLDQQLNCHFRDSQSPSQHHNPSPISDGQCQQHLQRSAPPSRGPTGECGLASVGGGISVGCDSSTYYEREAQLSIDTLINDLMMIITMEANPGGTASPAPSMSGGYDGRSNLRDDESSSVECLILALIPIATRLIRIIVTPEPTDESPNDELNSCHGLSHDHVASLLIRVVDTLQQDQPTDAATLLSCLELLNTHLTASRLENVLLFLPSIPSPTGDANSSTSSFMTGQPVQSHVQCLAILQILLPNCLDAMIMEARPSQSPPSSFTRPQQKRMNNEQDEEIQCQSLAWFQLRILTGILFEFISKIMNCNSQQVPLELWLSNNLCYCNPENYPSPEQLKQNVQQTMDLIRAYITELIEYAIAKLHQGQDRQESSSKRLPNSSLSPDVGDNDSEESSDLFVLQHAALATNALELRDDLGIWDHDLNRGLTRSLWRRLSAFVSAARLDRSVQLAASETLWKLGQQVVIIVDDPSRSGNKSALSSTGITSPAVLMNEDEAILLATTILRLVEHADYFWTDANQNWILRVLQAAATDAANADEVIGKRSTGEAFKILRNALYGAALSTQMLPHPNLETGHVGNGTASRDDKRGRLLQLALAVGDITFPSKGSENEFRHDDPWYPFLLRHATGR